MVRCPVLGLMFVVAGCADLPGAGPGTTGETGTPEYTFDNVQDAPPVADLVINEFMASNGGALTLKDKSTPDWIEVYNAGGTQVDASLWFISDNAGNRTKHRFEEGTVLEPGGFLLLYASGDADLLGPPHLNFGLSSKGEEIVISDRWGRQLDWVVFGPQNQDVALARSIDGDRESVWINSLGGTPGTTNTP